MIQLPPVVSQSDIVLQFFSQWGTDAFVRPDNEKGWAQCSSLFSIFLHALQTYYFYLHCLSLCTYCRPMIHACLLLLQDRCREWLIVLSQNLFNWYWSCQTRKLLTSPTGRNDEELVEKYHSVAEFAAGGKGEMSLRENEVVTVIEKNTTGL